MKIPFNKPFTIGAELENIAAAVRDGHLAVASALGGAPGRRCLRMADYVTGAGGHRRGDRRGKGLMLPMLRLGAQRCGRAAC